MTLNKILNEIIKKGLEYMNLKYDETINGIKINFNNEKWLLKVEFHVNKKLELSEYNIYKHDEFVKKVPDVNGVFNSTLHTIKNVIKNISIVPLKLEKEIKEHENGIEAKFFINNGISKYFVAEIIFFNIE